MLLNYSIKYANFFFFFRVNHCRTLNSSNDIFVIFGIISVTGTCKPGKEVVLDN